MNNIQHERYGPSLFGVTWWSALTWVLSIPFLRPHAYLFSFSFLHSHPWDISAPYLSNLEKCGGHFRGNGLKRLLQRPSLLGYDPHWRDLSDSWRTYVFSIHQPNGILFTFYLQKPSGTKPSQNFFNYEPEEPSLQADVKGWNFHLILSLPSFNELFRTLTKLPRLGTLFFTLYTIVLKANEHSDAWSTIFSKASLVQIRPCWSVVANLMGSNGLN